MPGAARACSDGTAPPSGPWRPTWTARRSSNAHCLRTLREALGSGPVLSGVLEALLAYSLRLTPGLVALGATFALWPRRQVIARILLLILGFVLVRDVLTPLGFCSFGRTGVAFWIRFSPAATYLRTLDMTLPGIYA